MRSRLQQSGWFAPLLITLFSLPALQNLWTQRLTCGFDNVFHLWRSVQVGAMLREGIWFSRWAPQMVHGYGYPLYQFQSPLSAYVAALFNVFGASWPLAVNLTYGVGFVGSGVATWWLGRALFGERGGLLAAVALLFAPYHLYVLYYRGSLSETVAWIFPPLVLWGVLTWQAEGRRGGLVTAVLSLALLFYTHDVTAYIFLPLFLAWPFFVFVSGVRCQVSGSRSPIPDPQPPVPSPQPLAPNLVKGETAVLLGILTGAFFWLPALVERRFIQFGRAGSAWPFLPENNFLPLEQLFALPRNANPLLLNDWPERGLSAVLLVLLLLGIFVGLKNERRRVETAVLTLFLLAYLFLVLPISGFLWDSIDPLAAFQFPWRFLSPVVLLAALLIGGIVAERRKGKQSTVNNQQSTVNTLFHSITPSLHHSYTLTLTLLFIIPLTHFGWLHPALCAAPADTTVAGMVAWERATGTVGTTASRELLPVTVAQLPQDDEGTLPWQGRFVLPNGVRVTQLEDGLLDGFVELEADEAFTAVYQAFAFPGWQATINGHPVEIVPSEPEGLITVEVPNGLSQLRVSRRAMGVQQGGVWLSVVSLLVVLVVAVKSEKLKVKREPTNHFSLITFYFLLPILLFALYQTPLFYRPVALDNSDGVQFGSVAEPELVQLVAIESIVRDVAADEAIELTLYWQALRPLTKNYRVGLTLYDESGVRWSEVGLRDYRWSRAAPPTTQWPLDRVVETSFYLDPLVGTTPDAYWLELTFFDEQTLEPLSTQGRPALPLGVVTILPPKRPFTPAEFGGEAAFSQLGGLRYRFLVDREAAIPGDSGLVTLIWDADTELGFVDLALVDGGGTAVFSKTIPLDVNEAGVWRQQQFVRLPASLEDGAYQWVLRAEGETAVVGTIQIDAPDRLFEQPEIDIETAVVLGERAALIGANVEPTDPTAGAPLAVSLVWQATVEMTESYRVFVQLLDENGQLVAGSDRIPANWTRPTTGWQVGEFVVDTHDLQLPETLPAGAYRLIVGMVGENGRLQTAEDADFIDLPTVTVPDGS